MFESHRKVSFNILTKQNLIKNDKKGPFWRVFENLKLKACGQIMLPDWSLLIGQKMMKNAKN